MKVPHISMSVAGKKLSRFRNLVKEWHPDNGISPKDVAAGSHKKYKWRCSKDQTHEWDASVKNRAGLERGCPYCTNRAVSTTNNLAHLFPDIASEWHPDNKIEACQTIAGTNKTAKWRCSKDQMHEWDASVVSRTSNGSGCPYCANKKVSPTNNLAHLFPEIASEWHPDNNPMPDQVIAGSHFKAKWRCSKDTTHEWDASVINRTRLERGCPYCANQKVSATNNLAHLFPRLVTEWHPDNSLKPNQVIAFGDKMVKWICSKDQTHEWDAVVKSRTRLRTGCPYCVNQKVSATNNLAHLFPYLVKEWHLDNGISPKDVAAGSHKKCRWICLNDPTHEWDASVVSRTRNGSGCPKCACLNQRIAHSDYIKFCKMAHQENYDYSETQYVDGKTNIVVICPVHGKFSQRPDGHLIRGCIKCSPPQSSTLTEEEIASLSGQFSKLMCE